jgi:heavy metal efflux system protein
VGLAGLRSLDSIRSISIFGLSDIKLYFSWDSDYYWDRAESINQLGMMTLPPSMQPDISTDNPIGEIYRYTVHSPDHNLMEEKEIEDWVLEKQLKTVPGVADVSGFGGLTKQYYVDVDDDKLIHYGISLNDHGRYRQRQYERRRQLS